MAEEDEEGTEEGGQPSSSGPGRYFALVLLFLLMEGAIGYWVLDQAVPAPEVAQEEIREEEEEVAKVWTPPIYYEGLKELIVEPTSLRGKSMVRLSLVLVVDDRAVINELALQHTVFWDLVLRRLELMKEKDFRDPAKKKIKSDLLRALNAELENPGVLEVLVTDIVMQ